MKKLIFIIILAIACAEEKVAPTFNTLEGWWNFSHKEATGHFEIVDYVGLMTVDNGPGNVFTIAGKEYPVVEKAKTIGTLEIEIFLTNSSKTNINFYEAEYNKDYTVITAKYWTYWHNGVFKQINEPLKITR